MEKNCEIIKDLLPNYIDKLTSDYTNSFIKEHLKSCEECNKIINDMKEELEKENILINKEIKYAKKFNNKYNILLFVIISFVICFIIFLISVFNKYFMLKEIKQLGDNTIYNLMTDNYYCKCEKIQEGTKFCYEVYSKDGEYLYDYYFQDKIEELIYENTNKNYYIFNYIQNKNGYEYVLNRSNKQCEIEELSDEYKYNFYTINFDNDCFWKNILNIAKLNNVLKIRKDNNCYIIEFEGTRTTISKEYGLIKEKNYNDYKVLYEYNLDIDYNIEELYKTLYKKGKFDIKKQYDEENFYSIIYDLDRIVTYSDEYKYIDFDSSNNKLLEIMEKYYPEYLLNELITSIQNKENNNKDIINFEETNKLINLVLDIYEKNELNSEDRFLVYEMLNIIDFTQLNDMTLKQRIEKLL